MDKISHETEATPPTAQFRTAEQLQGYRLAICLFSETDPEDLGPHPSKAGFVPLAVQVRIGKSIGWAPIYFSLISVAQAKAIVAGETGLLTRSGKPS